MTGQPRPARFSFSALDLCPVVLVLAYFEDEIQNAGFWSTTTLKIGLMMVASSLGFAIARMAYKTINIILINRK
jgi:hypothetical protein